ncbi:hypothetical protein CORC01_08220 [Colletotrichum orchidophilum]|uniref:Uncharacterized protein n=1 Tax=Colletotrichum orchidophilum TaxID=1209926 RepID=A0A1G4B4X5_9PEZI|nr:uncharacterized protein CORC01_08220 [Colletotrichum orchidophilum]OHE96457.1 hypothetical protein CORC01_08220 [Colletotrichum orchidophilum]
MGYCRNEAGDGGSIGRTRFCCDSQFNSRFSKPGICNIPAHMCPGISECCGTDFHVFHTWSNEFTCENNAVNKFNHGVRCCC